MSNDELPSIDEVKEFKEEGEEDKLSSENLHSSLKPNLIEKVRFVPFNSHGNPYFSQPLDYLHHPPPPAHMGRFLSMDLEASKNISIGIPPWHPISLPSPFTEFPQCSYFHSSATSGIYQSPFRFGHFLPSSLSPHHFHHPLFHSPPSTHHHHHHHLPPGPPPSSQHPPPPTPSSLSSSSVPAASPPDLLNNGMPSFPHIKKPLNAFMLFMKENRAVVAAESEKKESASINQILGKMWHDLTPEEQAKYYEKAKAAREVHNELYPSWTAKDNYAANKKKKKKREKSEIEGALKKCRARFGLEQQSSWCKPCRRKKKCTKFP